MFRHLNQRFWDWFYAPPAEPKPKERRSSMPGILATVAILVFLVLWVIVT